jgi:hypothetical protein
VILDDDNAASRTNAPYQLGEHSLRIPNEVKRIRREHSIEELLAETREIERAREVGGDGNDVGAFACGPLREHGQPLRIFVDRVDPTVGSEKLNERPRERPVAGPNVRPRAVATFDSWGNERRRLTRVHVTRPRSTPR